METLCKFNNSVAKNPDQFRKNIAIKIQLLLEEGNDEDYEIHAMNIEKSIFNYTIKESNTKKIIKKWENSQFIQLYVDRLRTVYTNMKKLNDHFPGRFRLIIMAFFYFGPLKVNKTSLNIIIFKEPCENKGPYFFNSTIVPFSSFAAIMTFKKVSLTARVCHYPRNPMQKCRVCLCQISSQSHFIHNKRWQNLKRK